MDTSKVWEEIVEAERKRANENTIKPGEMTIKQFCEKVGLGDKAATLRLKELVDEGKLYHRQVRRGGHLINVYGLVNIE